MIATDDCLRWLQSTPSQSIDHCITDPPYEAEAHTLQRRVRRGPGDRNAKVEPLAFPPITNEMRVDVSRHIARITRRWAVIFCQVEAVLSWRDALVSAGMSYRRTCVWIKPDGMPQLTGDRPGMGYESIVVCHARGASRWNGGGRVGVFSHNKSHADGRDQSGRNAHPTTKPLPLMLELVELFTDPGETVMDPFAGSGTTGVAFVLTGRHFTGCEIDPTFAELARDRLRAARNNSSLVAIRSGQIPMFGGTR
jgi:site-specific DNA-methyltransferase (adenine-specific)